MLKKTHFFAKLFKPKTNVLAHRIDLFQLQESTWYYLLLWHKFIKEGTCNIPDTDFNFKYFRFQVL